MLSSRRSEDSADRPGFRALLFALVEALHAATIAGSSAGREDRLQQDEGAVVQVLGAHALGRAPATTKRLSRAAVTMSYPRKRVSSRGDDTCGDRAVQSRVAR